MLHHCMALNIIVTVIVYIKFNTVITILCKNFVILYIYTIKSENTQVMKTNIYTYYYNMGSNIMVSITMLYYVVLNMYVNVLSVK